MTENEEKNEIIKAKYAWNENVGTKGGGNVQTVSRGCQLASKIAVSVFCGRHVTKSQSDLAHD